MPAIRRVFEDALYWSSLLLARLVMFVDDLRRPR
jgi:hypothetical protein